MLVKAGPLAISGEKQKSVLIPPVIGGVCVVAGIAVFVLGARKSS